MGASPSAPSPQHAEHLLGSLDAACAEAARLIAQADVLLLCTGAGFSADSGLAIYADVAKVKAYAQRGLSYHDVCQPRWLASDPELFWGFWGQCFNDYRETAPHPGYEIINGWVERRFRHSATAEAIRKRLKVKAVEWTRDGAETLLGEEPDAAGRLNPYEVKGHAGAFFVFTSNVDAHHFDWFEACEIRECHGNTELYQCSKSDDHCQPVWRIPLDFRFQVDKETMLAPACLAEAAADAAARAAAAAVARMAPAAAAELAARPPPPEQPPPPPPGQLAAAAEPATRAPGQGVAGPAAEPEVAPGAAAAADPAPAGEGGAASNRAAAAGSGEGWAGSSGPRAETCEAAAGGDGAVERSGEAVPRVGRVMGNERTTTLRNMPAAPPWTSFKGFNSNHPTCPFCGADARPAILMFGDMGWQDFHAQARQWSWWQSEVEAHIEETVGRGLGPPRAVILEIGAGGNVTTVRNTSEVQLQSLLHAGADARLVRVNPELPLGDEPDFEPGGNSSGRVVSVMARGLDSLMRMERAMATLRQQLRGQPQQPPEAPAYP